MRTYMGLEQHISWLWHPSTNRIACCRRSNIAFLTKYYVYQSVES